MSHQRAGHIYLMGRAQGAKTSLSCVELAIVVRIHTCVLVRPCCRCQALLPHRSTNDGVELPDGTPRGVRDLYPVWLPCFFSPFPAASPLLPPLAYLPSTPPFRSSREPKLSLFLSLSRFVPHRRSRGQDVLQNKRLYLHARPSEKPPRRRGRR